MMPIPNVFEKYITTATDIPSNIIQVSSPNLYLSLIDAVCDFTIFKNIILYAYSRRQYCEKTTSKSFVSLNTTNYYKVI